MHFQMGLYMFYHYNRTFVIKIRNMSAAQKIALVTGGSRGLGKEMALSLARKGIDVIITYRANEEEASNVVASMQQLGRKAAVLHLDMSRFQDLDQFVNAVKGTLQTVLISWSIMLAWAQQYPLNR
jgi:NAD(P)-dependent dehydrogenase (short-subunit alcohol dehydrogenase family)